MEQTVLLHGYRYSVYHRIARIALERKRIAYDVVDIDPFAPLDPDYLAMHPFGRVPVLTHGTFRLFETRAITGYVDRAFTGPPLQPSGAEAIGRMEQVIGIIDSYGYRPMVRQVFAQRLFRPLEGELPDEQEILAGLAAATKVLAVLEEMSAEGLVLTGDAFTLADCHLAPMLDYFQRTEEGREILARHAHLSRWWDRVAVMPEMRATDPGLPTAPG